MEIESITPVKGGVDIYARAWLGKNQIGFGPDGSVDIERFHIGNPPLLVPDPDGDIIRPQILHPRTGDPIVRSNLRIDPVAALRSIMVDTIKQVGKVGAEITPGKRGRTTYTLFSSNDGSITCNSGTYSAARGGTGTKSIQTTSGVSVGQTNFGPFEVYQFLIFFDLTSAGITGTLNSGTLSLWVDADSSVTDFTMEARQRSSYGTLDTSDFTAGASLSGLTRVASRSTSGLTTHAYNALTSDAAMLTSLATLIAGPNDLYVNVSSSRQAGNNSPAGDEFINVEASGTDGDAGGTSTDPKLVIVTASAVVPKFMYHYRQQGLS